MKFLAKVTVILIVTFNLQTLTAQTQQDDADEQYSLDSGNIDSQFEYVFRKSGNFKGTNGQPYEAVKQAWLLKLKANVLDSLKTTYKDLANSEATVANQVKEIDDLKAKLGNTQTTLDQTNEEKNNMALLGMQTSKTNYNVIMWTIIAALTALLLFFIYKFKNSNSLTKEAKYKLEEVESEFEEHRRNALEREQKVRRQLQDELNKNKA
ncbi:MULTISPECIES: tRNA (guanine-N1)-methyltransferase [Winogradskyella]|uniref:tRNA (guanine-N1)-methyltransferase n=1 Tax=Winogradskyella TaxID=286104 RepID=UPI000C954AC2|nr:tRNA (guanine-N1)-methyltransferase [Winogradskyella sp. MH6]MAB49752.1 tRNA (guanine-N1)-methyltransferase [Flavobacteriaceae bacterium]|tara:strand:- start:1774 stop:2400 length:627 start_codon:yes stop_codon:yes gene_type:complete